MPQLGFAGGAQPEGGGWFGRLPSEIGFAAAEMSTRRGLAEDRPSELQVLDNSARCQRERILLFVPMARVLTRPAPLRQEAVRFALS